MRPAGSGVEFAAILGLVDFFGKATRNRTVALKRILERRKDGFHLLQRFAQQFVVRAYLIEVQLTDLKEIVAWHVDTENIRENLEHERFHQIMNGLDLPFLDD